MTDNPPKQGPGARETRLINKETFDDPTDSCPAGSNEEFDLMCEWSTEEKVESIQELDEKLFLAEAEVLKLRTEIVVLRERLEEIIKYCKPHQEIMWAKYISGIAAGLDDWRDELPEAARGDEDV